MVPIAGIVPVKSLGTMLSSLQRGTIGWFDSFTGVCLVQDYKSAWKGCWSDCETERLRSHVSGDDDVVILS